MNFFLFFLVFFFLKMRYGIITVARGAFSAYDPTISLLTMTLQTLLVYYSRRVSCLTSGGDVRHQHCYSGKRVQGSVSCVVG